jgi:hypothetical protein
VVLHEHGQPNHVSALDGEEPLASVDVVKAAQNAQRVLFHGSSRILVREVLRKAALNQALDGGTEAASHGGASDDDSAALSLAPLAPQVVESE